MKQEKEPIINKKELNTTKPNSINNETKKRNPKVKNPKLEERDVTLRDERRCSWRGKTEGFVNEL
jgi:hypothetical protein